MTYLRWLAAALLLNAVPLVGQPPTAGEPSEALLQDAASYADQVGVGIDEAVRRLQLQREIGALDAALSQEERDLFAGLWIEHEPKYRVVVRFTHPSGEERLRVRLAGTSLARVVEMRGTEVSLVQLEEQRSKARQLTRQLRFPVDTDINVKENRAEIRSNRPQALRAALAAARAHLPDRVEIIVVSDLARPAVLRGGEPGSECTGGFTVLGSNNGELGISTAGHCGNSLSFQGVSLPFRSEDLQGNQDVQWHSACNLLDVSNEFNSGLGNRACVGTQHRDQQAIGAFVCKWGKTSGRTCGFIASKSHAPSFLDSSATFVWVDGAFSEPGDSGGPWFVDGIAYGISIGYFADDNDGIYMPINYISSIGAQVLTSDPGPGCNLRPIPTFTWTPVSSGYVNFDASGSYDSDGSIASYTWDFGDGSPVVTTTFPWVGHSYAYGDYYSVDLSVTDNNGAKGMYSVAQYVYACFLYVCD